ncbi:cobalt ABC transporter permease [Curvivirga sp.]|uniref:cobalt ABC transporter permease n=1 Tax=Curvivirga sp. TaxID=2856848 RepID=UPI003B5B921C
MFKYIKKNMAVTALAATLSIAVVVPAHAHKVLADAYASGDMIEGEVGFSNGDMAKNVRIEIVDVDGNLLGEAKTDEDGIFFFKPTQMVEHVFRADLGAGHVAEFSVAVEDLPEINGQTVPVTATSSSVTQTLTESSGQAALAAQVSSADLRNIRQEMKLLRKEIAAYKEKNDFQTILGGLGYIFGLCGLYLFFLARKEKKNMTKG